MESQESEKYTRYHHYLSNFNHNSITITTYEVECDGDDYNGFEAKVTGTLSNGLRFYFKHDRLGVGTFQIYSCKGSLIRTCYINLNEVCEGYGKVLNNFLINTLNFNF